MQGRPVPQPRSVNKLFSFPGLQLVLHFVRISGLAEVVEDHLRRGEWGRGRAVGVDAEGGSWRSAGKGEGG